MVTGDADRQTEGNLRAEKGAWEQAQAEGGILPKGGVETLKGKAETCVARDPSRRSHPPVADPPRLRSSRYHSAIGIATGDSAKQNEGNIRVEKASWLGK